jgi:ribonucleoside-diphosphate reductase alpha chain
VKTEIKVRKRTGEIVGFDLQRIVNAIYRAGLDAHIDDWSKAEWIAKKVRKKIKKSIAGVEEIQDLVEKTLMENQLGDTAKQFILFRDKKREIRELKKSLDLVDDLKLDLNAAIVLNKRYLIKNEEGKVIETPKQMFKRIAKTIAENKNEEEEFYELMVNFLFIPNSPTLMNAGTSFGQLSACFVLPVEDSLESIFESVKNAALIHQTGGGTGFSFSKLRPKNDIVRSTGGVASGPVSFMKVFDTATGAIKQGGRRRGANMGILSVNHPDVEEFIKCKEDGESFSNFNISIAVTEDFMRKLKKNEAINLVNPRTNKVVRKLEAKKIFELMALNAWKTGDPGIIFIDEINRRRPTKEKIDATNPCGEEPLLGFESCNLGSINISKFVCLKEFNWDDFEKTIRTAVRFLDNVIDKNNYVLKEVEKETKKNRKIGLGVMGFADALIKMGIQYDSKEALNFAEKVSSFMEDKAVSESSKISLKKGVFPAFKGSLWHKKKIKMRNSTVTTIAPTGTISIISGCSSGIEPLFAVAFVRNVMEGTKLFEVNKEFERIAKERGFHSKELMMKIAKTGSVQNLKEVPSDVKKIFKTALDIPPEWHVKIQSAFQKHTDNAVSKTCNLPENAGVEDVKKILLLAHKLKCKGITIYRYGSKKNQVLSFDEQLVADSEFSGGCSSTICEM